MAGKRRRRVALLSSVLLVVGGGLLWLRVAEADTCVPLCCALPLEINEMGIDDNFKVGIDYGAVRGYRGDIIAAYAVTDKRDGTRQVGTWAIDHRRGAVGAVDDVARRISTLDAPRRYWDATSSEHARACLAKGADPCSHEC